MHNKQPQNSTKLSFHFLFYSRILLSFFLYVYLFVRLSVCLSICFLYLVFSSSFTPIHLHSLSTFSHVTSIFHLLDAVRPLANPSIHPSICLSVPESVRSSIHPSVSPSAYPPARPLARTHAFPLVRPSIHPSIHPSIKSYLRVPCYIYRRHTGLVCFFLCEKDR